MALQNITYFGQATNRTQIRENIIWYLRDSLIGVGGYYNVTSGTLGFDENDISLLEPSYDPSLGDFRVWKGFSHEWAWESGVSLEYAGGAEPIRVSGVYVADVFYPTGTAGTYAHYIDYNRGAVVFTNTSLPSGTKVWAERSERAAFVYPNESNEYRQIVYEHQRFFEDHPGSGQDTYGNNLKAFLPSVFIDVTHGRNRPYELGSSAQIKNFRINCDVFAEDLHHFDFLRDACLGLATRSFTMFDANTVSSSGAYPLSYRGELDSNPQVFSGLCGLHPWKNGRFGENSTETHVYSPLPLQVASIALDFELVG